MSEFKPSFKFINNSKRIFTKSMSVMDYETGETKRFPPVVLYPGTPFTPRSQREEKKLSRIKSLEKVPINVATPPKERRPSATEDEKAVVEERGLEAQKKKAAAQKNGVAPAPDPLAPEGPVETITENNDITNINDALRFLRNDMDLSVPSDVRSKTEIIEYAKDNNIVFPKWED